MTYAARRPRAYEDLGEWDTDDARSGSREVEDGRRLTGLLDRYGRELACVPEPVGFLAGRCKAGPK